MNEQEETELQVLQSIWEDDFLVKEPRLYCAILRPDAHITLGLEFDCRNTNYPDTVPKITIKLIQGRIIPLYKEYLERTLTDAGYEKIGLPMMYDLTELAKQEIEINDLTQGSIGILVPDILLRIFEYLNYRDLTSSGVVNKKWKLITSDDSIWKPICSNMRSALQLKFPSSDLPLIEQDTPYRCYFNIARKQLLHQLFLEHPYILSIQSDPTNSFQYPMTPETMADQIVKFIVQKLICNVYPPANITPNTYFMQSWQWTYGSYTLFTVDQAKKFFGTSPWFYRALNLHKELKCPYIGPVVGFIAMNIRRFKSEEVLRFFFSCTRGLLVNISLPTFSESILVKSVQKYEVDLAKNSIHILPTRGQTALADDLNGSTKYCKDLRLLPKDYKGTVKVIPLEYWHINESITNSIEMIQGAAATSSFEEFAKQLLNNTTPSQEKPIIYK